MGGFVFGWWVRVGLWGLACGVGWLVFLCFVLGVSYVVVVCVYSD